jgi:CBS domain-containing protein
MRDAMAVCNRAVPPAPGMRAPVLLGFTDADLKVCAIMTDNVICAVPGETVLSAVRRMSECRVSCVIVVDGDTVVGILTERDVLRGVAAGGRDPTKSKVAERMSSPVVSVTPDSPVLEASAIMGSKGIKRLAVIDGEQLLGLVTQTDITRGLVSLWPYKEVADIMSMEVVTADASATVAEAAGLMSSRNISCVVVMRQCDTVGIMTEKDVLKRVVALHRDPGTTLVAEVMSHPIVTLPPSHSIMCVSRMMDRMRIHRLVVKENKQVYGIVSQTDILDAVRGELEQIREAQLRHESEVSQLTESTAKNLSSIESLVREASGLCEPPGQPSAPTGIGGHASCGNPTSMSHGHHPASAVSPILISLQNLISESKSNLDQISRIVQRRGVFSGDFDSTN